MLQNKYMAQKYFSKIKYLNKITCALLVAVAFFVGSFVSKEKVKNNFPLIDMSRNFIPQSDFITNLQPLREKLKEISLEYSKDDVSIYIEFFNTGANISINPDTYIWPASLTKVPVGIVALKKVQDGEWDLDSELVLMSEDVDAGSGDSYSMIANEIIGTRFTIEELLRSLLEDSDNTAYHMLYRNISTNELLDFLGAIGLEDLIDNKNQMSAKEYSRIFRSLYTASYLDRKHSQLFLEILNESKFTAFLRNSIPEEVPFPHKYGEHAIVNTYSDSGIVYLPNRPYIITVMVRGDIKGDSDKEQRKAADFMNRVSSETYNYLANYSNE